MRHVIRVVTHMIVSGTCMLLFAKTFESSWELAGYSFLTMLLVACLYGVRRRVNSFWIFLGCHLLLLLGGGFLTVIIGTHKWYVAIWCFWILYSAILRLVPAADHMDEPVVAYIIVLMIEYFGICALEGSLLVQRLNLISTGVVFLLYILYRNLDSMDEFIYVGSFSNEVDEQGIRKLNHRLTFLYVGILGALLGVFSLFRLDGLWHTLSRWFRALMRFLVSFIPISEQIQPEEKEEMEQGMSNLLQEMVQENEPSAWMQLLGEILRGIIAFVIVAAILVGIIRVAIRVYRHFYNKENREEGDKVIEALSFGAEITKERKTGFFERFERSPARRIRRIYKKSLKRTGARRMSRLEYLSPDEQVQFLRNKGLSEEAIDEIRTLYEKARYSADFVTETEAERMRAIL